MADKEYVAASQVRRRISPIIGPSREVSTGKFATTADLAFVDAAIAFHRASLGERDERAGGIAVGDPAACDVVDVVAAVVAVTVVAYHAYNSCLIGEDLAAISLVNRLNIAPEISLEKLVEARNEMAKALEVSSIG